jgi:hypothetical protein
MSGTGKGSAKRRENITDKRVKGKEGCAGSHSCISFIFSLPFFGSAAVTMQLAARAERWLLFDPKSFPPHMKRIFT